MSRITHIMGGFALDEGILSVGIDIGTSTTQLVFSRLRLDNTAGYFSVPKISIVEKNVVYESAIYSTPLFDEVMIDSSAVKSIVAGEFEKAGFSPNDTSTGAVIITGESARKENAAAVIESLSAFAGDFVVATAGPDLESVIAGKGSGAQKYSLENSCVCANLDIGGGTTNIVVFDCGETVACGCLDIGGRQIRIEGGKIAGISAGAQKICRAAGLELKPGDYAEEKTLVAVCDKMAQLLFAALKAEERSELYSSVTTAGSSELMIKKPVRYVFFSGGVADCIYSTGFDSLEFGDIGVYLGRAVRSGRLTSDFKAVLPEETIRATVVGAGTYTTTVSGSTIAYSDGIFPFKNVPVFKLGSFDEQKCLDGDSEYLAERVEWFMKQNDTARFVLAFKGRSNPSYGQVITLAKCISAALTAKLAPEEPLLILVESDMAKALGQVIRSQIGTRGLVCIDSVRVEENNYIDMGKPLMDGLVIPVVVKTLIFG